MDLNEAIERADAESEVKARKEKGFYMSSAVAFADDLESVSQWTLAYFEPKSRDVFSVKVTDSIEVSPVSEPLVDDHYERLDLGKEKPIKELLGIVKKRVEQEDMAPLKAVIALRAESFSVAVFTKDMKVVRVDLEPESGKITHFEISNMLKTA
jgi:hypothetical protein